MHCSFWIKTEKTSSLYVAGTEERILAGLEYGVIRGIVAWSGYGVGYQAVEQAASAVLGKEISEPVVGIRFGQKRGDV